MKRLLYLFIFVFLFFNINIYAQTWISDIRNGSNFDSIKSTFDNYWKDKEYHKGDGYKIFKRWEYFWKDRVDENGNFPKALDAYRSYLKFLSKKNNENLLSEQSEWQEIGPRVVPTNKLSYSSSGAGRINVIRVNPSNDNELWVGSASGGIWKSSNKGLTWNKMGWTDIMSIGVSDIAFSPSNPKVMYAATGDKDGFFQEDAYSIGLMKSEDGGENWSVVGLKNNFSESFLITKILVDPNNSELLTVATSRGIYKSTDGGINWTSKLNGFFRDLEFKPNDKNIIYAVSGGFYSYTGDATFYKSTDGGENWKKIFQNSNVNRFEIAVTPADPNYVYVIGAVKSSGSYAGVWRSKNAGDSFDIMSSSPNILSIDVNGNGTTGQGFYDLAIAINPINANEVYIGGIHIWKSSNEGRNWTLINHWTGGYGKPYVHADQHYLLINPNTLELFSTNDGGVYVSSNNGVTWKDISNGLGIAQFYKISVANSPNEMITGGTQDNGTHLLSGGQWYNVNGGDGMQTHINPQNSQIVFCTTQNGSLFRSTNGGFGFSRILGPDFFTGESAEWVTPFELNPLKPTSILIGYKDIYKSVNNGSNWSKISDFKFSDPIDLIAYSPSDTNYIYVVNNATIYSTKDGGNSWIKLGNAPSSIKGIAVDYDDPNRFWVSVSSFRAQEQVFEFYGQNRTNISYDLPAIPVNTIVSVKNSSGKLVIGTDIGIYYKEPSENIWKIYGKNMPPVIIADLEINYSTGKIYAGTFGRGVWVNEIFACKIEAPEITTEGALEFCYGDSTKLSLIGDYANFKWSNGDTSKIIYVKESGSYYVTITDKNGCSARSKVVNINVKPVPSFEINAENGGIFCDQDSLLLTLPIGVKDYLWNTGETNRRIWIKKPGNYYATATSPNGCPLSSNIIVAVKGEIPPKPKLERKDSLLVTDPGYKYRWYYQGKLWMTTDTNVVTFTLDGDYQVEILNDFPCSSFSDILSIITFVGDASNNSIIIAPNPTNEYIEISGNALYGKVKITISNLNGQTMISNSFDYNKNDKHRISLNKLAVGIYNILIECEGKLYKDNVIKYN